MVGACVLVKIVDGRFGVGGQIVDFLVVAPAVLAYYGTVVGSPFDGRVVGSGIIGVLFENLAGHQPHPRDAPLGIAARDSAAAGGVVVHCADYARHVSAMVFSGDFVAIVHEVVAILQVAALFGVVPHVVGEVFVLEFDASVHYADYHIGAAAEVVLPYRNHIDVTPLDGVADAASVVKVPLVFEGWVVERCAFAAVSPQTGVCGGAGASPADILPREMLDARAIAVLLYPDDLPEPLARLGEWQIFVEFYIIPAVQAAAAGALFELLFLGE